MSSDRSGTWQIYDGRLLLRNGKLGPLTQLTHVGTLNADPAWHVPPSPSCSGNAWPPPRPDSLVFTSNRTGPPQLFLLKLSGGVRQLTFTGGNWNADWAPYPGTSCFPADGSQLAFTSDRTGRDQIWLLNLSGGVQQVTKQGANRSASWDPRPAANELAFESNRTGTWQIFTVNLTSGVVQQQTKTGTNYQPTWSPAGSSIVFVSTRSGAAALWSKDLRTGKVSELTPTPSQAPQTPAWQPVVINSSSG